MTVDLGRVYSMWGVQQVAAPAGSDDAPTFSSLATLNHDPSRRIHDQMSQSQADMVHW